MLVHPTVECLRALGLTATADAFVELQNAPDAGELRLANRAVSSPRPPAGCAPALNGHVAVTMPIG